MTFGYAAIPQYVRDARAYEFTASEISAVAAVVREVTTEQQWSSTGDQVEEVFSREHVTSQASLAGKLRQPPRPAI